MIIIARLGYYDCEPLQLYGNIAIPYLIKAMGNKEAVVCQNAIWAISTINDDVMLSVRHEGMHNDFEEICLKASQQLSDIGTSYLLPLLEDLKKSTKDHLVIEIAENAVNAIESGCKNDYLENAEESDQNIDEVEKAIDKLELGAQTELSIIHYLATDENISSDASQRLLKESPIFKSTVAGLADAGYLHLDPKTEGVIRKSKKSAKTLPEWRKMLMDANPEIRAKAEEFFRKTGYDRGED